MGEIRIKNETSWSATLLAMEVGERAECEKKYFGYLTRIRQAASRLRAAGKGIWVITSNCDTLELSIKREK